MTTRDLVVWIIHSKQTQGRFQSCERLLSKIRERFAVSVNVVKQHDSDELSSSEVAKMVSRDAVGDPTFDTLSRPLTMRQASNLLKHRAALENVVVSPEKSVHLVLEDDVVHGEDMVSLLSSVYDTFSTSATELALLGLPYGKDKEAQPRPPPGAGAVLEPFDGAVYKVLPSCDSYMVSPLGAVKLLKFLAPMRFATNVQLSYAIRASDVKTTVCVPNVFLDGSKIGTHVATIEPNNPLIYNPDFHALKGMVTGPDPKECDANVAALEKNIKFGNHPEIVALFALHHARMNRHEKANEMLAQAYETLVKNAALVNGTSMILRLYISSFRALQKDLPATYLRRAAT